MLRELLFFSFVLSTVAEQPFKIPNGDEPQPVFDPNSPTNDMEEVVKFATEKYNADGNSLEKYDVGRKVSSVSSEEGKQYDLMLELHGNMGTTRFVEVTIVKDFVVGYQVRKFNTLFTVRFPERLGSGVPEEEEPRLAGGYHAAQQNDTPAVRSAAVELARIAQMDGSEILICDVKTQVVNGMNYKLTLGDGSCEEGHKVRGVVYKPFQGDFKPRLTP